MKILYGIQATGNGHMSRSIEIIKKLKEYGHTVKVLFSGIEPKKLWDKKIFGDYEVYNGFTFKTSQGKIDYFETIRHLRPLEFFKDILSIDAADYDLVISDFEPISSKIAKRFKIPSIGISHQAAFLYKIPQAGSDVLSDIILKNFAPVDIHLGLHYYHFGLPLLPPLISKQLFSTENTVQKNKILVYLPFEDLNSVLDILSSFHTYEIKIYHDIKRPFQRDFIQVHPLSRKKFIQDLLTCEGVIANAGFMLTSETLYLGKKLLSGSLRKQFEQQSNAKALEYLNLGDIMHYPNKTSISLWLEKEAKPPLNYPDISSLIADFIHTGEINEKGRCDLISEAWRGFRLP